VSVRFLHGHVVDQLAALPERSIHCVVTSPPYFSLRDYHLEPQVWGDGWRGSLGLEDTVDRYVAHLVQVFAAVWRVLRDDGTLWLNLGDGYFGGGYANHKINGPAWYDAASLDKRRSRQQDLIRANPQLKPKDLIGMPWRIAFALQAAGWWLRSEIIWAKPNPMPESVEDRPTRSHEQVFLLAKREHYYFDSEAIREPASQNSHGGGREHALRYCDRAGRHDGMGGNLSRGIPAGISGRNCRSVWTITTAPFAEAHFATFPPALVEPCLLAGTSEKGCCVTCGAPYARVVERSYPSPFAEKSERNRGGRTDGYTTIGGGQHEWDQYIRPQTIGWRPTCTCQTDQVTPCVVLDPFCGAGTTLLVAQRLGRDAIGIDLNATYLDLARRRVAADMPLFYEERPDSSRPLGA
jgi:DNA modification methylase